MVTDSDERGVVPLVRVAVKVTGWLTVGVVVDAVRIRVVAVVAAVTALALSDEAALTPGGVAWTPGGDAFPTEAVNAFS
jgi:hypothetical protein